MMRRAILMAAILMAASILWACDGRKSAAGVSGQIIELTGGMLDRGGVDTLRFGRLHEGEMAVRSITLRNGASEPAVIVTHERSCGCVDAEYERRPIMPGEESKVEFTFDSRGEYGWQMKLITLRLGGRGVPLKIYIEAEVE